MCLPWLVLISAVSAVDALDNGLALTPPMGWLTWERFRCLTDCKVFPDDCISESLIKRTADLMVSEGYLAAGYKYLGIDDCWLEKERGPDGRLVPDRERFPSGMKAIADYLHSRGLYFGLYQDYGNKTCAGYPGVLGHEQLDVDTFLGWDVDYVKLDGCYVDTAAMDSGYPAFGKLLNKTGRPILYSCSWPAYQEDGKKQPNYNAIAEHCNLWRNWDDIDDSWESVERIMDWFGDNQGRLAKHAGPGHWNDPDMLLIGNFGLSHDQARVQMAVWAVLAAPLLMSVDLATMPPAAKDILLNRDIIAVNQDPLGKQGLRVYKEELRSTSMVPLLMSADLGNIPPAAKAKQLNRGIVAVNQDKQGLMGCDKNQISIWTRELSDGSRAVAFVSQRTDGAPYYARYGIHDMQLPKAEYDVQDLYNEENKRFMGPKDQFAVKVNPTGVKFYKFIPRSSDCEHNIENKEVLIIEGNELNKN